MGVAGGGGEWGADCKPGCEHASQMLGEGAEDSMVGRRKRILWTRASQALMCRGS